MRNYEHALEWIRILSLFSSVFIAESVIKNLEKHGRIDKLWLTLLIGFVAIATMHVLELVVTTLFHRSMWIKQVLLGDEYIEGVWFDIVVGKNHYGLINIHICDGRIFIVGETFNTNGDVTATFEDYMVKFEGRTLRGAYYASHFNETTPMEVRGLSTYILSGNPGEVPKYYSGFFNDIATHDNSGQVQGFKITDNKVLGNLKNPNIRKSEIMSLIKTANELSATKR